MFFSPLKVSTNRFGTGTSFWTGYKEGVLAGQRIDNSSAAVAIDATREDLVTYDSTFRNPVQKNGVSSFSAALSNKSQVDIYWISSPFDYNVDYVGRAYIGGTRFPAVDNVDWSMGSINFVYSVGNLEDADPQNTFILSRDTGGFVFNREYYTISDANLSPTKIQVINERFVGDFQGLAFVGHDTSTESTHVFLTNNLGEITYNRQIDNTISIDEMIEVSSDTIFVYTKYSDTSIALQSYTRSDLTFINKLPVDTDVRGMAVNGTNDLFAIIEDNLNWYDSNLNLVATHVITELNGESLKGQYRGMCADQWDNIHILYYNSETDRSTVDIFSQSQFTGSPYQSIQFDNEVVGVASEFKARTK